MESVHQQYNQRSHLPLSETSDSQSFLNQHHPKHLSEPCDRSRSETKPSSVQDTSSERKSSVGEAHRGVWCLYYKCSLLSCEATLFVYKNSQRINENHYLNSDYKKSIEEDLTQ